MVGLGANINLQGNMKSAVSIEDKYIKRFWLLMGYNLLMH